MNDGLHAHVVVERSTFTLDVRLDAAPGQVVAVVGPNGSGKSTLLGALAGLVPLDRGEVRLGQQVWDGDGARLPMHQRAVGMAYADLRLFPHLSARDNVAYGPRARGVPRSIARTSADAALERFGIGDLADRRPGALSSGQAQRVGLARALASGPDLLLLDEPLAALDVTVATRLRTELALHLASYDGVAVLVTHDAIDAVSLADRVLVLEAGQVVQDGTPEEVVRRPASAHVARLVGLNVLTGVAAGTEVRLASGEVLATSTPAHGDVHLTFAPSAVTLSREQPTGSARNRWSGTVLSVWPLGSAARVHVDVAGGITADVTAAAVADLGLRPGTPIWAAVKATEIVTRPEVTDDLR